MIGGRRKRDREHHPTGYRDRGTIPDDVADDELGLDHAFAGILVWVLMEVAGAAAIAISSSVRQRMSVAALAISNPVRTCMTKLVVRATGADHRRADAALR